MTLSGRRIRAIVRKEIREYARNRSIVVTMAIFPLIFAVQPLIAIVRVNASGSGALSHEHVLLFMLGIPALVPAFLAATAVAGERQQGTLEPALTTPIRREEFLLGKALSALIPALVVAYAVFVLFLVAVARLAAAPVAAAVIQGPDLLAQVIFTPLLASSTIWLGIALSTRASDVRVAQQLGVLASLPAVLVTVLIALDVIPVSPGLGLGLGAFLIVVDVLGWRLVASLFDRERLMTGGG